MDLKGWAEGKAMGTITGLLLHRAASGEFGPQVKAVYWFIAGKKTSIALWLGIPTAVLEVLMARGICTATPAVCADWTYLVHFAAGLAAAFAYLGQVDGALRLDPPPDPRG